MDRLFERERAEDEVAPRALLRWGLCFAVIVALHVGVAWIAIVGRANERPLSSAPAAIMIEMTPLPNTPAAPPDETPPSTTQEVSQPPPPEAAPEAVKKLVLTSPDPPPPVPAIEEPIPLLAPPPTPAPKVEVPLPPKPVPRPPKPPERVVAREPVKVHVDDRPPAPPTPGPSEVQTQRLHVAAAPAAAPPATASPNAIPTWQGLLVARLRQFKRYPSSAQMHQQQGVAYLRFTMNRSGNVLSAQIARSSGFDVPDEETLALVRRAEPLPPPPPNYPGDPLVLVVPIEFFLAGRR